MCKDSQLQRYQIGSEEIHSRLSIAKIPDRNELISRVTLSFKDLEKRGIEFDDLEPFLFQPHMKDLLVSQQVGNSCLDRHPLISTSDEHLIISMPSALSVALRDFVIQEMLKNDLTKSFDDSLAKKYSRLFYETPLLGGPFYAPVHWKMSGEHRIASFFFKVDSGFYIFYQLFLPSIKYHNDGGFKEILEDDGALTYELQKSIDTSVQQLSKKSGFKQGLLVLVSCGWGKGYATKDIIFNYPNWRFESISVADLIRLSAIEDLNPEYFWKIQEGFEVITRNGVEMVNASGILNLIGWVRKNNGHFVPHAQLPDEEISVERPIILHIPTNMLRDIRAEADQGYDRHSSLDNMGKLHDVQHHSAKPLFISESLKKLFVSITDVSKGVLTFVYEGKFQIWLTVLAQNIDDRNVEFRLGEMAREWLHRIGNIFDEHISLVVPPKNLKVYAEFQDDTPTNDPKLIQAPLNLVLLCETGDLQEKNSKIAIFKKGFLDGFRVAENIAERWFVFNVVRTLLTILGYSNINEKTKVITDKVVKNTEARSFHIFYTQQFLDYVRGELPKKLIEVNEIDHGTAKLGLGWRALNSINIEKKNKITGKDNCRKFLHKVVDILISEISVMLGKFDRKSTLLKLIANCEKAYDEENHWRKTSSAVLGLHGANEKTLNQYVEQTSKFTNAAVSSRVLIEMTLCQCSLDNGNIISNIELSKLIARASLVIQYGGLSDAIRYNTLPPELHISALGDILFKDDFRAAVVEPMLSRASSDKYVYGAPHQRKNYDDPVYIETTKQSFDKDFWNIWIREMGFNIDEGRNIIDSLENEGIERQNLIFELKREDYFKLVCSEEVSKEVAEHFLERFTLRTRKRWNKVPHEFALDEIYPWRYGRRLSFVACPILEIEESDNPTLLIAPGSLRMGFIYLVDGTLSGRLKQSFFQT